LCWHCFLPIQAFNLNSAVESTASHDCTDSKSFFDDFLFHRMIDTPSIKNHQKNFNNQHIHGSRYDSTAEFRFKIINITGFLIIQKFTSCYLIFSNTIQIEIK
jgi:hypothetical protein